MVEELSPAEEEKTFPRHGAVLAGGCLRVQAALGALLPQHPSGHLHGTESLPREGVSGGCSAHRAAVRPQRGEQGGRTLLTSVMCQELCTAPVPTSVPGLWGDLGKAFTNPVRLVQEMCRLLAALRARPHELFH